MSASWDWKTNISEVAVNKTADLLTGNPVPDVQSAVLFQGAPDDSQIYLYGGVTPTINQSFPYWQWPTTNQYTLCVSHSGRHQNVHSIFVLFLIRHRWGFNTQSHVWTQYDILSSVPERPSWGASAEAPDQGLAFYMNGMITNASSVSTEYLGGTTLFLEGMVVLDLNNQTVLTLGSSTAFCMNPNISAGDKQIDRHYHRRESKGERWNDIYT